MKPGSIVECIDDKPYKGFVKLNTPYTVISFLPEGTEMGRINNNIIELGEDCIFLSEVKLPPAYSNGIRLEETPFAAKFFRELLPPIENIEELINENVHEFELV